jgi:hypothetical protein
VSKSFEQIFSQSNPHGFTGYDGPCKCCEPKPTEKVTKAYNRGVTEERERIIKLLERLWEKTQGTDLPAVVALPEAIALIKGENK